jgi:hypothetical protein
MNLVAQQVLRCLIALSLIANLTGCASPYHIKKITGFDQRMLQKKTIGLLDPIDFESNKESATGAALQGAVINKMRGPGSLRMKLISKNNYEPGWDANVQRISKDSREILKEMELERLWKDTKTDIIVKSFPSDIKLFKNLDPDLDALLIVKCNQHYGNPWANGLLVFGLVGGLIASATAGSDPVIGSHVAGDNDTYSSAVLVDLDTGEVLWYSFSLRIGIDVTNTKHAEAFANFVLHDLVK